MSASSASTTSLPPSSVSGATPASASPVFSPSPSPSPTPQLAAGGSSSSITSGNSSLSPSTPVSTAATSSPPPPPLPPPPPSSSCAVSLVPSGTLLDSLLSRRALLEDDLRSVERQLVELEESYMEESAAYGNVVRGWDGFLSSKLNSKHSSAATSAAAAVNTLPGQQQQHSMTAGGSGSGSEAAGGVRRSRLPLRDRLFSSSSSTAPIQPVRTGNGSTAAVGSSSGGGGAGSSVAAFTSSTAVGGFSLSSGELDLSGGLVGFDSSLPAAATYTNSAYSTSVSSPGLLASNRRSTGRRGGGMDTDDGNG